MTRETAERLNASDLRNAAAEAAGRIGRPKTEARNALTREQKISLVLTGEWPIEDKPVNETSQKDPVTAGPGYPPLGVVASAKVMNVAEHDGQFAIEVMLAGLKHRESGKRFTSQMTRHGVLLTVTDEAGRLITILAEESVHYGPQFSGRKGGGLQ